jgi:hypothetical protein
VSGGRGARGGGRRQRGTRTVPHLTPVVAVWRCEATEAPAAAAAAPRAHTAKKVGPTRVETGRGGGSVAGAERRLAPAATVLRAPSTEAPWAATQVIRAHGAVSVGAAHAARLGGEGGWKPHRALTRVHDAASSNGGVALRGVAGAIAGLAARATMQLAGTTKAPSAAAHAGAARRAVTSGPGAAHAVHAHHKRPGMMLGLNAWRTCHMRTGYQDRGGRHDQGSARWRQPCWHVP